MRTTTIIAPLRRPDAIQSRSRAFGLIAVGRGTLVAAAFVLFAVTLLVVGLISFPVRLIRRILGR